jgi:hypothetical protein
MKWLAVTAAALLLMSACGGRSEQKIFEPGGAGGTGGEGGAPPLLEESDKLDVLFVIDNTRDGQTAHGALAATIPYFLDRLTEPVCVNGLGQVVERPPPGQPCSVGLRDFEPLRDIHIGVLSTSLGGHGADTCSPASPNFDEQQNDDAQLLERGGGGGQIPTYLGLGFLAWDPDQEANPPGDSDPAGFEAKLLEIVTGVGGRGCGFEAPLEAFYRFLIDPMPYAQITREGNDATLVGVDQPLLEQRAAFLRPDSALLIVLVSDEDDCSIRDGGQYFFAAESGGGNYHLPKPRSVCATDPDDACCASCGQSADGCPPDPTCGGSLSEAEDPINLRCFDNKRRFGIDFLQPIARYVEGLTERSIADREGNVSDNPLFTGSRSKSMVVLAAIAGVPWQDIAHSDTNIGAGFTPPTEIRWQRVLGASPEDPLMQPSRTPRSGENPVTGDPLAGIGSPSPQENPINGHEHLLPTELQFACTYPLAQPISCAADEGCECFGATSAEANPVCQLDDGTYSSLQRFGRATPAPRQLTLVRELATTSVLASICTTDESDPDATSFAYRPAVDAILRTLRRSLVKPALEGSP